MFKPKSRRRELAHSRMILGANTCGECRTSSGLCTRDDARQAVAWRLPSGLGTRDDAQQAVAWRLPSGLGTRDDARQAVAWRLPSGLGTRDDARRFSFSPSAGTPRSIQIFYPFGIPFFRFLAYFLQKKYL